MKAVLSDLLLEVGAVRVTPLLVEQLQRAVVGLESEHAIRMAATSLLDFVVASVSMREGREDGCIIESVDARTITLQLEGECCSHSLFEERSVAELKSLVGERIRDIEHVASALPPEARVAVADSSIYRALKITTDKRVVVVDWRNDSNGYYDGVCRVFSPFGDSDSFGVPGAEEMRP